VDLSTPTQTPNPCTVMADAVMRVPSIGGGATEVMPEEVAKTL
jgi:hypothetical protein